MLNVKFSQKTFTPIVFADVRLYDFFTFRDDEVAVLRLKVSANHYLMFLGDEVTDDRYDIRDTGCENSPVALLDLDIVAKIRGEG